MLLREAYTSTNDAVNVGSGRCGTSVPQLQLPIKYGVWG